MIPIDESIQKELDFSLSSRNIREQPFIWLEKIIVKHYLRRMSNHALRVLIVFAYLESKKNLRAKVRQKTIAGYAGLSVRMVSDAIKELRSLKLIRVYPKVGKSCEYELLPITAIEEEEEQKAPEPKKSPRKKSQPHEELSAEDKFLLDSLHNSWKQLLKTAWKNRPVGALTRERKELAELVLPDFKSWGTAQLLKWLEEWFMSAESGQEYTVRWWISFMRKRQLEMARSQGSQAQDERELQAELNGKIELALDDIPYERWATEELGVFVGAEKSEVYTFIPWTKRWSEWLKANPIKNRVFEKALYNRVAYEVEKDKELQLMERRNKNPVLWAYAILHGKKPEEIFKDRFLSLSSSHVEAANIIKEHERSKA